MSKGDKKRKKKKHCISAPSYVSQTSLAKAETTTKFDGVNYCWFVASFNFLNRTMFNYDVMLPWLATGISLEDIELGIPILQCVLVLVCWHVKRRLEGSCPIPAGLVDTSGLNHSTPPIRNAKVSEVLPIIEHPLCQDILFFFLPFGIVNFEV